MNGLSTAAPHPPPPRSSSTSIITSLTSRSKTKQCGVTGSTTTTSLAEALATSVADLVCDLDHRKLINGSTAAAAAADETKLGLKLTQQHTPVTATANTEIQSATSSTQSTMDTSSSSSQPSPPDTSAPRSSMSSAVADLASGMSIFQPANISAATTTATSTAANSSFQNNSQHRNYPYSTKTISSAPIISGTAAAVLALQSASSLHDNHSNYYDNIVLSNSVRGSIGKRVFATEDSDDTTAVVENNLSCVPNPLLTTTTLPHSSPGGDDIVVRHVSSPTINTTASNCSSSGSNSNFHSPSSNNNSSTTGVWTLPKFPTRYSDGAPIIAGTAAAAQIEASIATAARITSLSAGSNEEDTIIHAVASLGPCGIVVGGGESCHSHGFSSPGEGVGGAAATETEYHYWNGSTTAGPLTITTQGSKALSWVDHRANNYVKVTPLDGSSTAGGYSFNSSPAHPVALVSSSQHCTASADHGSHTTGGGGGGMDMLAEITCHAPPMILPTDLSQDSTTTFNATSYLPQNAEIISDQETCYQASSPQGTAAAQHSQIHDQQRVSIIPSYQEIYREMGIPHQHSYNPRQPQHQPASYSVEEIEVDACHLSHASDHHHQHQQQLSHGDCTDPTMSQLHSRTPTLHFGQVNRDDIEEGKELYTRTDLYQFGGHVSESKDVHGNMKDGCDSIVIGNLEKDLRECDGLLWFLFSTDRANGGGALCQSYHKKRPIRVFRSSLLGGKYAPPFLDVEDDEEEDSDVAYRYDGLYMVRAVWDIQGQETESHPVCGENGWQTYFFTRLPKRPLEKEKWEGGMEYNAMGCQELWSTIQKMRGVRKPKKFEIPPPPVKLGQMKKCAITGQWKERKRAGYVKPVAEMDVAPPKQVSKSKRVEDINSSEFLRLDDDDVDDSDSDCSQKHQHHTPSHEQSPSKVLTPRPRLNSIPDPKKASPTKHHHNDADSSDSESITSDVRFNSKIDRRKSTPSSANNGESSNNVDVSMFFPKRASAARAEAANRDMFGGSRSYKRKSSESAVAASYQPLRSGAGRKRTKIRRHDDSSSSEEEQSPDLVDSSILTIGSRVLVSYKGQLFKATIRKRREKAGADDFLIHYDGNKKSNVHWIGSDRINKILEINVDTPPQKNNSMASQRNKRTNGETKKKSLQNQESIESSQSDDVRDEEMSEAEEEKVGSHCESKNEESVSEPQNHDAQGGKCEVPLNIEGNVDVQNQSRKADSREGDSEVSEMKECKPDNETVKGATIESQPESPVLESGASMDVEEMESEIDLEQTSCNIQAAKSPKAAPKKKRETTVTDVCFATAPRPSRSIESRAHSDAPNRDTTLPEADSISVVEVNVKEPDENSISSSDNPTVKHASSVKTGKFKYSEGGHVYVEYRNILYSSTILKSRKKRSTSEYLVHYEGYKKSSNTWVKESALHEVNAATTQRFEVQRLIHCDSFNQSDQAYDFQEVTKRRVASDSDPPPLDSSSHSVALKKPPPRRTRSDASDLTLDTLDSGVAFLAGSMVFVEWTGELYLAKMLKKRYSGEHMEYLISYDGYKSNHDAWVSVQKIYEVNPQTKRVFKKLCSDLAASNAGKQKRPSPPGPQQRETRRKSDDVEDEASAKGNGKSTSSLTRVLSQSSRSSTSTINTHMQGIETGVEFLPGSTLFAVYKDGLCLAKMLKKRGKGEYTEYLVQYNGLKKVEEAWVSTGLVYEINPQTKRMFRKLSVTK